MGKRRWVSADGYAWMGTRGWVRTVLYVRMGARMVPVMDPELDSCQGACYESS